MHIEYFLNNKYKHASFEFYTWFIGTKKIKLHFFLYYYLLLLFYIINVTPPRPNGQKVIFGARGDEFNRRVACEIFFQDGVGSLTQVGH